MNSHPLNAAPLNGADVTNAEVNLGDVTAGIIVFMYERDASPMAGTVTLTTEAYGNLSRVVQIGAAVTRIDFSLLGDLSEDPTALIGPASSAMAINIQGALTRLAGLEKASSGIALDVAGMLASRRTVSGTATLQFDVNAILTQYVKAYLPVASAMFDMTVTGTLVSYSRLSAPPIQMTFTTSGLLARLVRLQGATGITFTTSAALFNNPEGEDLDSYTMTRPYVDRTMVRKS